MEKIGKTLDETKFKFPENMDEFRDEIIKNLQASRNAFDVKLVLEEYYGEIVGRLASGEI